LPGLLRATRGARLLVVGDRGGLFGSGGLGRLGGATHGLLDQATGPMAVVRGPKVLQRRSWPALAQPGRPPHGEGVRSEPR
jgi:hypothetical protein